MVYSSVHRLTKLSKNLKDLEGQQDVQASVAWIRVESDQDSILILMASLFKPQ